MMVTIPTCDTARRHNVIKRKLNLISRWDNIHCGMAEMNRLYEHPIINGDWELIIRGYNSGTNVLKYPKRYARGNRMNKIHLSRIKKYRNILVKMIGEYKLLKIIDEHNQSLTNEI
jgi:hypothetical protein